VKQEASLSAVADCLVGAASAISGCDKIRLVLLRCASFFVNIMFRAEGVGGGGGGTGFFETSVVLLLSCAARLAGTINFIDDW